MRRRYVGQFGGVVYYTDPSDKAVAVSALTESLLATRWAIPDSLQIYDEERDVELRCWYIGGEIDAEVGFVRHHWLRARDAARSKIRMFWWNHPMPFGPLGAERRRFQEELKW